MFIIHPKDPLLFRLQRDGFVLIRTVVAIIILQLWTISDLQMIFVKHRTITSNSPWEKNVFLLMVVYIYVWCIRFKYRLKTFPLLPMLKSRIWHLSESRFTSIVPSAPPIFSLFASEALDRWRHKNGSYCFIIRSLLLLWLIEKPLYAGVPSRCR